MADDKINIVYLGELGFPNGFAGVQRALLLSKGLHKVGANVTVLSRKGIKNENDFPNLKSEGTFEGINYLFTSGTPYRPNSLVVRNIFKIKGLIREVIYLYKAKYRGIDSALLSTREFGLLLYYRIVSKVLKFPLILNCVELNSAVNARRGILKKINDYLYEKYVFRLIDGVLPISDFLLSLAKKSNRTIPCLKIPILCDFNKFNSVQRRNDFKYLLFCGSAVYIDIISFILNAFGLINTKNQVLLYLIINGNSTELISVEREIKQTPKSNLIRTFSNITYNELVSMYVNALGLLIPIRPTIEDRARFPHKIGEYTAAGKPIITTSFGEVPKYFVDNNNALIAENYSVQEYAEKMSYVISNPKESSKIGKEGKIVGLKNFSYEIYGPQIKSLIMSLNRSKN